MKKLFYILFFTTFFGQSAFAGGNWCHTAGEDLVPSHPNFHLSVDYQIIFNGGSLETRSIWINLKDPQVGGRIFVRMINHYFYGQNLASPFVELQYQAIENKFTGEIPAVIDLGGVDSNMIVKVWQTLEIRYGNINGPSETKNLNMSKVHLNQKCFVTP